jgi:crotonobetainyl-CoA:carnitine CoA-transferase CaiB-like acyl-CoA transferase
MDHSDLPLKGIRVLDLTTSYAGPFCTMFLGDMGADVVKIEEPLKGDDSRYWGPPFYKDISPWYLSANRNKRSITLNIRDPRGMNILERLIEKVDVFVVSLAVKALERLNLTYDSLQERNSGLIYCSITGFGHSGPYRNRPCYDLISEGIGGIMGVTGDDNHPEKVGTAAGDILAAHQACFAIASCIYRRTATGRGDFIDVCLVDSVVSFVSPRIVSYLATGELPRPDANRSSPIAIYQPIRTRDSCINVGIGNDRIWERICRLLGLEELLEVDKYKTNESRKIHRSEIVSKLEAVLMTRETRHWFDFLSENGVPCGPINYLNDVVEDRHIRARGMIFSLESEGLGSIAQVGSPWKLGLTGERNHRPPPGIGEHDDEVYGDWLGMGGQELEKLRASGIIRKRKRRGDLPEDDTIPTGDRTY